MKNNEYLEYKNKFEMDLNLDKSNDEKFFLFDMDLFEFFNKIKSWITDYKAIPLFHSWEAEIAIMSDFEKDIQELESNCLEFIEKCMETEKLSDEKLVELKNYTEKSLKLYDEISDYCNYISKKEKEMEV